MAPWSGRDSSWNFSAIFGYKIFTRKSLYISTHYPMLIQPISPLKSLALRAGDENTAIPLEE
jgi:hypothetical protein